VKISYLPLICSILECRVSWILSGSGVQRIKCNEINGFIPLHPSNPTRKNTLKKVQGAGTFYLIAALVPASCCQPA